MWWGFFVVVVTVFFFCCAQIAKGQRLLCQSLCPCGAPGRKRAYEEDRFWVGQSWCSLNFWISTFRSNFTSGLATICSWDAGQGHGAGLWWKMDKKKGPTHHLSLHAESHIAQRFLLKCSSATLCFRCFPFLAASSREPALKWMIACDRRIKSINPTLIKRGMMN